MKLKTSNVEPIADLKSAVNWWKSDEINFITSELIDVVIEIEVNFKTKTLMFLLKRIGVSNVEVSRVFSCLNFKLEIFS